MMQKYVLFKFCASFSQVFFILFLNYYGMVGNDEETVGFDEKTAAFISAFNDLKKSERKTLKQLAAEIGIREETNNMIRAGRRMAYDEEIQSLVKFYPNIVKKYPILIQDPPAQTQEPMEGYFNGGAAQKLIKRQEEMIEMLKSEVERLKGELDLLKTETEKLKATNKVLTEIVTKNNQK